MAYTTTEYNMADAEVDLTSGRQGAGRFPLTHWSVVVDAGKDSSPGARDAFGELYRAYLPPLLAYLRCQGKTEHEAEDLVQGFFAFLLEKRGLGKVRREGRFRNWLLVCLKRYLSDLWDRSRASKRGGGEAPLPLDGSAEDPALEPSHPGRTPDEEYEHEYAIRFLELAMTLLEKEYAAKGKSQVFTNLHPFLLDKKCAVSHAQLGALLGVSEASVTTEISRMRKRYRAIFDEELAKLVGGRHEMEEEKRFLFASLTK